MVTLFYLKIFLNYGKGSVSNHLPYQLLFLSPMSTQRKC